MNSKALQFEALEAEYRELWRSCELTDRLKRAAEAAARAIIGGRSQYAAVEADTGIPWFVVGLIHQMECGGRWTQHLHNGDPLTERTRRVPAGRPAKGEPPFSWHESAIDALVTLKKLDEVETWSPERICFELERYNGWGYRRHHPECLSPYLWSGTNHYVRGKYVADGKWSATAVSQQPGAMAILRCLIQIDPAIGVRISPTAPPLEEAAPTWAAAEEAPTPREDVSLAALKGTSRKVRLLDRVKVWMGAGAVGAGGLEVADWQGLASQYIPHVKELLAANGKLVFAGLLVLGVLVVLRLEQYLQQDYAEGRYTPRTPPQ